MTQLGQQPPGLWNPAGVYGGAPEPKKGPPWWAWLIIALMVIGVIGVVIATLTKKESVQVAEVTNTPAVSNTPTQAASTVRATSTIRSAVASTVNPTPNPTTNQKPATTSLPTTLAPTVAAPTISSRPAINKYTSQQVIDAFKSARLEVIQLRPYNTGFSGSLPFQYIDGFNFDITIDGKAAGGSVTNFQTNVEMDKAKAWVADLGKQGPLFSFRTYQRDNILVAISSNVPDATAKQYESVLANLK